MLNSDDRFFGRDVLAGGCLSLEFVEPIDDDRRLANGGAFRQHILVDQETS